MQIPRPKMVLVGLILLSLTLCRAAAFLSPDKSEVPNFDRREGKPIVLQDSRQQALTRLKTKLPEANVHWDELLGSPRWVYAKGGHLTGPNRKGKAVVAAALLKEPHGPTKAFLNEHAMLFGHGASALEHSRVVREFTGPHNGLTTVVWHQEIDHIPVFDGLLISHTTKNGELAGISSRFVPDAEEAATRGTPNRASLQLYPTVNAQQAIIQAASCLGDKLDAPQIILDEQNPKSEGTIRFLIGNRLKMPAMGRLVWLPVNATKLRLCWEAILSSQARAETFRVVIDAETGEAWLRHCLTTYLTPATYRVFTRESPTPFSPAYSSPCTNQPLALSRELVVIDSLSTNASPEGWIPDGTAETRGNNVDAYTDRDSDDLPDLPRPQGSPERVFDFALELTQAPTTYSQASVVQLFYWCNWMHDKLYDLGFTEAAGNFQENNFGRGGLDHDALRAEAQDGGGVNNANMSTWPDGFSPRLQMYIFTAPSPDRDGSLDAEIVLHEYAHGLSNRRVGGGAGVTALQAQGLGEGWSDFYALALLRQPGDDPDGSYACGAYVSYCLGGLKDNYYFGMRRYPYSTDLTKNPLTFKDIDPSQASTHADVPRSPVFGRTAADDPHAQGELWCMVLWEARANLIHKHGFEVGAQLMLQLVTDAMNLCPPNPNFLEARDALIQADLIATSGANFDALWQAFAKRGLGFSATSPASSATAGVTEAFDLPDTLWVTPAGKFLIMGPVGGPFKPFYHNFILTNLGAEALQWHAGASQSWLKLSSSSGTLAPGEPAMTITASVNGQATLLGAGTYTNILTLTNLATGRAQSQTIILSVGARDYFTESFARGNNDIGYQTLTFTPDGSANFYSVCRESAERLPTDPQGGNTLLLGDDKFQQVKLEGEAQVSLYGRQTNVLFIGSNGYVTMDSGDTYMTGLFAKHFQLPRIAGLFADLNPTAGGRISWLQLVDRVAVSFENVPQFGLPNSNTFQIEMFFDGRIRLTHLGIDTRIGLVGLSDGKGLPENFFASDLTGYPSCSGQLALILPHDVSEGNVVPGQVILPFAATNDILVSLFSGDTSQLTVPETVLIPTGITNATIDVTVLEDGVLDGTQIIPIRAWAPPFGEATVSIWVHDHETATLTLSLPSQLSTNTGDIEGIVSCSAPVSQDVIVFLESGDPATVQVPAFTIISAGTDLARLPIRMLDNASRIDAQTVIITAHVQNWIDATATIQIPGIETTPEISISDVHLQATTEPTETLLPVTLSKPYSQPVTVYFQTQDGTGLAARDYIPTNGLVTFLPGVTNQNITVTILQNQAITSNLAFIVILSDATNASLGQAQATISIEAPAGPVIAPDHFEWGSIPSPQFRDLPFAVTLAAKDPVGQTAAGFQGMVSITAFTPETSLQIGAGTVPSVSPLATASRTARSQFLYRASEIGPAQTFSALALDISTLPGQTLSNWTIRIKPTSAADYLGSTNWESEGWTTVCREDVSLTVTGWVRFDFTAPFAYDGTNNLMLDFSFNNDWNSTNGACNSTETSEARALQFQCDGDSGDPLTWSSSSGPQPVPSNYLPNLQLITPGTSVPIQPADSVILQDGVWSGTVTVQAPATNLYLRATDSAGRVAVSKPFRVVLPEEVSPRLSMSRSGDKIRLSWPALSNLTYRVEFKDDLGQTNWTELPGDVLAVENLASKEDAFQTSPQRFYRVKLLQLTY